MIKIFRHLLLLLVNLLFIVGCGSLQGSKFSPQDKSNYPKASVDADQVLTLISNKDGTQFTVDGVQLGNAIGAGGELKVLINNRSHNIVAQTL